MVTTGCSSTYCIQGTDSIWDDVYSANTGSTVPSYDGELYWTGSSNGYYIYYNSATTQWCLSTTLGGTCLLSGPSPSPNSCPNLSPFLFSSGDCPTTTTTTTNPCNDFDFDAYFDCYVPPTTTTTSTSTTTTTTTIPPTICVGVGVDAIAEYVDPIPTSTTTTSTTTIAPVVRDCIFFGDVTFNTINSIIECPALDGDPLSEQFQDCFTGELLYAPIPIATPSGDTITKFMIFRSIVNGESRCISYLGQNTCNTGVNNIVLIEGPIGYSNLGDCDKCTPPTTTTTTTSPDFCVLGTEDFNFISSELEEYLFEVPCYSSTTTTTTTSPSCSCPEGYTLLPDGVTCEEILEELATPPLNPRIIGVNYEDYPATNGGRLGLLVYEEITNKGWPIFGLPNIQTGSPSLNSATPSSLSIIPVSGYTNQGILYNSLSPSSLPNTPHASLNYPFGYWPVPYPPTNNPPNTPNLSLVGNPQSLSYLSESFVSSGVLNLGSGSSINIEYNRYDAINLLWGKYSVSGSWASQVGVWSDAPSPPNTSPLYVLANTWIGITQCIEIPESKKYYILVNANNAVRITINGLLAVELNNGDGEKQALAFVNCFPISLSAGTSIINVEGGNYFGGGNLAFELLDIPIDDLLSATTYSSIEPYVIFSTKQKRPRAFDINFISGSTTITSSSNFSTNDVGAFVQFPSFVYSGTYITQVIDSSTAIINSGATATGLGVAGVANGSSTGRIYFIFDTGQLFASGLPQGFTCPAGYTYVNCGGPTCLSVSRVNCT